MKQDHYTQWGDQGHTLVFIHYFGGNAKSWQWVARRLCGNYRCIALCLPGFGKTQPLKETSIETMAEWAVSQLDTLGIDNYTIIGHSMGGKIALQMAAFPNGQTIHRLILIAPSPPSYEPMPNDEKERMLKHPDSEEAKQTVKNAIASDLDDEKYDYATNSQLEVSHTTWKWWLLTGMDNDISTTAKQLTIPITVLASENDAVISKELIQNEVLPNLSNVKALYNQNSGHLIPMEAPVWTANQIVNIVEG